MAIQARGTHKAINTSLMQVVALCPEMPYGLAVWVFDAVQGYVAPISSLNLKPHDNVDKFHENFLRTKVSLEKSAVGDFVQANENGQQSKNFSNHCLSHHHLGNTNMVLQIVGDTGAVITLSGIPDELMTITFNAHNYGHQQKLRYEDVFGLKDGAQDRHVVACDINGFTNYTGQEQSRLENMMNDAARDVANTCGVDVMQVLGDQVRFSHDQDSALCRTIHDDFHKKLSRHFGANVAVGSVAAYGEISQSFNGNYDDLRADKHYKGDVLTRIGTALKTRSRQKSSFRLLS